MDTPPKKVLIVEDNELDMKFFHDLLEAEGYHVLQAKNGLEALNIARKRDPDLILMDIQLPGASGLEVTQWIKEDDELRSIPVVMVTAFLTKNEAEYVPQGNFDAYVSKPISIPMFIDTVHRFLD